MSNSPLNTRQITFVESALRENRYQLITDPDAPLRVWGASTANGRAIPPHPGTSRRHRRARRRGPRPSAPRGGRPVGVAPDRRTRPRRDLPADLARTPLTAIAGQ